MITVHLCDRNIYHFPVIVIVVLYYHSGNQSYYQSISLEIKQKKNFEVEILPFPMRMRSRAVRACASVTLPEPTHFRHLALSSRSLKWSHHLFRCYYWILLVGPDKWRQWSWNLTRKAATVFNLAFVTRPSRDFIFVSRDSLHKTIIILASQHFWIHAD